MAAVSLADAARSRLLSQLIASLDLEKPTPEDRVLCAQVALREALRTRDWSWAESALRQLEEAGGK